MENTLPYLPHNCKHMINTLFVCLRNSFIFRLRLFKTKIAKTLSFQQVIKLAKAFLDITLYLIGKITFVRVSKNIISILGRKIPHKIIITFRTLYTKHIVQCINDIRHIHCKYLFDIQNVVNKLDMYIIIKSLAEKALFKLRFKPQHIPSYRRAFTASVSRV